MSEKFRLDRKIDFQNTFYTKCINVIIDSIGPSIILRSIVCSEQSPMYFSTVYANSEGTVAESSFVAQRHSKIHLSQRVSLELNAEATSECPLLSFLYTVSLESYKEQIRAWLMSCFRYCSCISVRLPTLLVFDNCSLVHTDRQTLT